jgi:hypothetical protein
MRFTNSKKAQAGDFTADVVYFILYITALILFFVLFSISFSGCDMFKSKTNTLTGEWNHNLGEETLLQNYLRTNLTVEDNIRNFGDLLAFSCQNNNFEEAIDQTKALVNSGLKGISMLAIEVKCDPDKSSTVKIYETVESDDCPFSITCMGTPTSEIDIPLLHSTGTKPYAVVMAKPCSFNTQYPASPTLDKTPDELAIRMRCLE